MARPTQFRAKQIYNARMRGKANKNLEIMAIVGNGDGATFQVAGRDSFYWIRLVNDDNRLTQCFCDICALSYGDMIFVARAKDEKLSYYEFVRFIQNADGDTTDPPICPKFAQVVYVSENSCQFNTVGAAVTYINALVTGPAAGRLFLIKCQAGNFGEAGDVTIPQYVHLEGVGEASELEMGANTLILSGDTSVSNIVVESSDPADAIRCNGVTNVVLRNVRGIQGEAADVFHIYGASLGIEMYGCIAEATVGNAVGFHVGDTADVYLDNCIANDPTNFADALLLDATLCAAVTRRCTFVGNGDDVQTGANSVWYHLDCHFYETNCTLAAGTHYADPTKRFNQTLIVAEYGGDFQALSEAITFINAQGDAAAGKLYGVLMLTGNFAEAGDVTIPSYVHVAGMGEGTRIEMGANDILMSNADASLLDLVVITTDDYAVNITASVTLRNVRAEVSGTALAGFRVGGGSPKLYDCICDPGDATASGFYIGGAGTTLLDHCIADDSTLFTNALDITGTATAITRYCCFAGAGNDVNQAAGTNWYHFDDQFDPSNIALGGTHVAMPGKRFNQTVIVAEEGGDFQRVLEAVTWINAQGDAASSKRYGILVLTGNFAEAAGYTIPQWVTVSGMGEGTRIEMGGNLLTMSDDSGLQDLVITSSNAFGINMNNADCVLFNVKLIMSADPGYGMYILGDSAAELYHVVVEFTASGATYAFHVAGTATPLLWDCKGDDATNIQTALNLANSACTCTTRYCVFHGSTDDVATGAASTWIYHQDDFDPDNCTVGGTAEPADGQEVVYFACTKTAGAASDFATVQAAIDWFKNRLLCADCKIDIVTGTSYAETLVIEDVFATAQGRLELEGDTRGMTGATFVDDAPITCQDANAGSGTCALSNAGAVITVTGTVANPDFDADGWGNGDTVITRDNAGAIATYTISATLNNTITLTVAAPAVGNTGTSLTLVPDTVIAPSGAGNAVTNYVQGILLDGLYLDATAGATGHGLLCYGSGAQCQCENILSEADEQGFLADWGALIEANDGACTAVECTVGFYARYGGGIAAELGVAVGCGTAGFYGARTGMLLADDAVATDCTSGFLGGWLGGCWCDDAYALQNTSYGFYVTRQGFLRCNNSRTLATNGTDYRSEYNSYMSATNTNVGGPTYSPAVSDTEGNVYGIITFS